MAASIIPQPIEPIVKSFLIDGKLPGNAGFHNSVYRGKYLGDSLTADQSTAILAGTFDDLFIGDYWTINGVDWVIAECDPKYRTSDRNMNTHHIGVIPRGALYTAQWNSTNDTTTGYVNSLIRTNIRSSTNGTAEGAQLKVIAAFGDSHVLPYRELYPSAYSGQNAVTWAWVNAKVELMSEFDVYGANIWAGNAYEIGTGKHQLAIFRLQPDFANIRAHWWLRSVSTRDTGLAATVAQDGQSLGGGASQSFGVRPLSLIA